MRLSNQQDDGESRRLFLLLNGKLQENGGFRQVSWFLLEPQPITFVEPAH